MELIVCWPAAKTIAANLQLSCGTVKRAIHDLTRDGLVDKKMRYRGNGA